MSALDTFLADPALAPAPSRAGLCTEVYARPPNPPRARFRADSEFARTFKLPPEAEGEVWSKWAEEDGQRYANVWIEGGPMCFGVRWEELRRVEAPESTG